MPSFITLGVFVLYVLPDVEHLRAVEPVLGPAASGRLTAALHFAGAVLTLSVVFAYAQAAQNSGTLLERSSNSQGLDH